MKTKELMTKTAATLLLAVLLAAVGCNNADTPSEFSAEDTDDALSEAFDDSANDDAEDLAVSALSSDGSIGGKIYTTDDRFECAEVTRTGDKVAGTVRIDFGDGCTDKRGRVRRGAILITYTGLWSEAGSSWTVALENYFVNDVQIRGTRQVKNITTDTLRRRFQVDLEDGEATWPDGRIARRRGNRIREHVRDGNSNLLIRLIVYGTAEGNHRNGRGYQIEILEPLVYERSCAAEGVFIPVKGKKLIKHGNRQLTVDYGDGTCDNVVTLINANGRTKEIRIPG